MNEQERNAEFWRDVEIEASLICNSETGCNWLTLSALQKQYFRKTAFARMLEKAIKESGEYEKLSNGKWKKKD